MSCGEYVIFVFFSVNILVFFSDNYVLLLLCIKSYVKNETS